MSKVCAVKLNTPSDLTPECNEDIMTELEAAEFERIFEKTEVFFDDKRHRALINRVFYRIMRRFKSIDFGLESVYFMGFVCGIRTERKRKAEMLIKREASLDER